MGAGTLGAAIGTAVLFYCELMYEAFYSYPINDAMTVTPLIHLEKQQEMKQV